MEPGWGGHGPGPTCGAGVGAGVCRLSLAAVADTISPLSAGHAMVDPSRRVECTHACIVGQHHQPPRLTARCWRRGPAWRPDAALPICASTTATRLVLTDPTPRQPPRHLHARRSPLGHRCCDPYYDRGSPCSPCRLRRLSHLRSAHVLFGAHPNPDSNTGPETLGRSGSGAAGPGWAREPTWRRAAPGTSGLYRVGGNAGYGTSGAGLGVARAAAAARAGGGGRSTRACYTLFSAGRWVAPGSGGGPDRRVAPATHAAGAAHCHG